MRKKTHSFKIKVIIAALDCIARKCLRIACKNYLLQMTNLLFRGIVKCAKAAKRISASAKVQNCTVISLISSAGKWSRDIVRSSSSVLLTQFSFAFIVTIIIAVVKAICCLESEPAGIRAVVVLLLPDYCYYYY